MKIALAQIDTTVGDIRGNARLLGAACRRARGLGADLVLAPELAVAGYPAWDLLEQRDFVAANLRALKELARETRGVGLWTGFVDVNRRRSGKPLFNAAALLHDGKIAAVRHKTLLPTYDVFDEARYFEPAAENKPVVFRGVCLGLTICEDAWNDAPLRRQRLYRADPVRAQLRAGARVLLNLSASPYHRGKRALRHRMLRAYAAGRCPFLYCNLVGGDDELLFDGNSFALDGKGRLVAHAGSFEEDLIVADLEGGLKPLAAPAPPEPEDIHQALVMGIRDYARKCGFREVLVGLSGGIDSALVCELAAAALGPGRVTGVSMPSMYSSPGSVTDAAELARNLGVRLLSLPIAGVYDAFRAALEEPFRGTEPGVAEQNLQARIRGTLLMALSNKQGALLLTTGNKSELAVGYCTLYGDMNGGLAVIADLPKTTVYEVARWVNRRAEIIPASTLSKPPSAELKPDQRDLDDLPPYDSLDDILRAYIEERLDSAAIVRRGHSARTVADILRRVDASEYKRRQAPPGLRITPKAFGIGRRMPIARGTHRVYAAARENAKIQNLIGTM